MSRAKGFARTSKYAVIITPPTAIQAVAQRSNQQILRDGVPATVADAKNLGNGNVWILLSVCRGGTNIATPKREPKIS